MDKPTLKLIGGFSLTTPESPDGVTLGKKVMGLLAYLALSGGKPCTREHLSVLLWPDRQDEQARQSLRQAISSLRKSLGSSAARILRSDSSGVRIDTDHLDVDVLTFHQRLKENTREATIAALEDYHGDFMEQIADLSDGFDTWRDAERYTMKVRVAEALDTLTMADDPWLATETAYAIAKIIADRDLLSEPAHRALIRYYGRTGQISLAHRQFQFCRDLLKRDLGLEPDQDTQAVLEDSTATPPPPKVQTGAKKLSAQTPKEPSEPEAPAPNAPAPPVAAKAGRTPAAIGIGASLFLLVLVGAGLYWIIASARMPQTDTGAYPTPAPQVAAVQEKSIAILPFRLIGNDPRGHNFVVGLTFGLTTAMSMISDLKVIASGTTLTYRDSALPPKEIGAELDVGYVLEGSIQLNQERATVMATLVDVRSGRTVWTQLYERDADDIVLVQKKIMRELLKELQVELTEGEQARIIPTSETENLEAWLLASKALQATRRMTPADLKVARDLYNQSLALDPQFSSAISGLAWTHVVEIMMGSAESPDRSLAVIAQTAEYLADNEEGRAARHSLLSFVELFQNNHDRAVEHGLKSIEAMPASADFNALYALVLIHAGRYDPALELIRKAMDLSPAHHDWYFWAEARAHRLAGRPEDALKSLEAARNSDKSSPIYCLEWIATLVALERMTEARRIGRTVMTVAPDFSVKGYLAAPSYKDPHVMAQERDRLLSAGLTP